MKILYLIISLTKKVIDLKYINYLYLLVFKFCCISALIFLLVLYWLVRGNIKIYCSSTITIKKNSVGGPSRNTGIVSRNTGTALGLHYAPSPVANINSGRTTPTGTTESVTNSPVKIFRYIFIHG